MSGRKTLSKKVQTLVGSETEAEVKLKKIYERVQSIKNLDFVQEMSEKERKNIKTNENVTDVLKRNYGRKNQIARTFAAMARAAGYEAYLVRVVSRDDKFFNPRLPLFNGQFDSEIVMVKLGSKFRAFDPGQPDCPFGVVYWPRTSTAAIAFENEQMKFFTSPSLSADDSIRRRVARLRPDGLGNLTGTIRIEYTGQEALSRKFENREKDEIKIKEILEEELLNKLPEGSRVSLKKLEGLKDRSAELVAEFEATVAGVVQQAGDKLLLPVYALTNSSQYPFRSAFRKYPIYFNYPLTAIDEIRLEIPEGCEVESLPEARSRDSERSGFFLKAQLDEQGQLLIERKLAINKNLFPVEDYIHLKEFFDFVMARDEYQIVLRKKK
ncbi:MAG: transglutaminase domain-containing protein [Candidatus Saccharicenans sp.]|uniref:transglutaminase domain-containing protein n=1 Tax=Candidatus Saccharicenans sp. TaxID=2819258 RepID=UPI00404A12A9